MNLYRYNTVIGRWDLERTCTPETGPEWLRIFSRNEPHALFVLAEKRPLSDSERALRRQAKRGVQ